MGSQLLVQSIYETNGELCKGLCASIPDLYKLVDYSQFGDFTHVNFFLTHIPQTRTNEIFKQIINSIYLQKYPSDSIQKLVQEFPIEISKSIEDIFDEELDQSNVNTSKLSFLIGIKTISDKHKLTDVPALSNYMLVKYISSCPIELIESSLVQIASSAEQVKRILKIFKCPIISDEIKDLVVDILFDKSVANNNLEVFDLVVCSASNSLEHLLSSNPQFILGYLEYKPAFDQDLGRQLVKICCSCRWNEQNKAQIYSQIMNKSLQVCGSEGGTGGEICCDSIASLYICNPYYLDLVFPSIEQLYIRAYGSLKDSDIFNMIIQVSQKSYCDNSPAIYTHIIEQTGFDIRYNEDSIFKYAKTYDYSLALYLTRKYFNYYRRQFSTFVIINEVIKEMDVGEIELCPICLDTKSNTITNCSHQFCSDCIAQYDNPSCPICRRCVESYYSIRLLN